MTVAISGNRTGILCAVGAAVCFSTNDMLIKLMSGDYPLHQIILIRATLALIVTLAVIVPLEGGFAILRTRRPGMHLLRGATVVIANMTFFVSLAAMPIADATAIFFVSPLMIAALSVVFLGETVGPRRWASIGVGLAGVLIVIRPTSESFQLAALLPVVAALCYALLHIMTRKMGLSEKAATMSFYIQLTFIFVSSGFGVVAGDGGLLQSSHPSLTFLLGAWVWPDPGDYAWLALLGLASAGGGYLISQAYRTSEAGLVAPFEYVAFVMAIFWGYFIWGDVPTAVAALGMALVLGSGLYLALREAAVGARPSARRASGRR